MDIDQSDTITVEGKPIGQMKGFLFAQETSSDKGGQKPLSAAAETALAIEITRRAKIFANVGFKSLELNFDTGLAAPTITWEGNPIATVHEQGAYLAPRITLIDGTKLDGDNASLVAAKTQEWLDQRITDKIAPLINLAQELNGEAEAPEGAVPLSGAVRGVAFQLMERYGVLPREIVAEELKALDNEARKALRRFGIRIGSTSLYIPFILKPHATEIRLMMWAMAGKHTSLPPLPTPGMVWVETDKTAPQEFYTLAGFRVVGNLSIRADMLERLADAVRPLGQGAGWFEVSPEIMGLVGVSGEGFAEAMAGIGYKNEIRKVAPAAKIETPVEADSQTPSADVANKVETAADPEPKVETVEVPEAKVEIISVPEAKDALEDAPTDAKAETEESGEPELVERYFFHWQPKRPKPQTPRRPAEKQRPANAGHKGKNGKPNPKAQIKKPTKFTKPKVEKPIDMDSPFAALAGLKDQLSKKK